MAEAHANIKLKMWSLPCLFLCTYLACEYRGNGSAKKQRQKRIRHGLLGAHVAWQRHLVVKVELEEKHDSREACVRTRVQG